MARDDVSDAAVQNKVNRVLIAILYLLVDVQTGRAPLIVHHTTINKKTTINTLNKSEISSKS